MKKKYVCISFFGGIGDQIFQYSFANYLKKKLNCEIYIDLSYYSSALNYNNLKFRLQNISENKFKINDKLLNINFKYLSYVRFIHILKLKKISKLINNFFFKKKINRFCYEYFLENNLVEIKSYNYYYGYWHNFEFVKIVKNQLVSELLKKILKRKKVNNFVKKMISKNSVCLHVRGGDFKYIKSNNILDEKYYKTAILNIKKLINKPEFHIFTDDIILTKRILKNLSKKNKMIFIKKYKFSDIEEFTLFSNYKYAIIANSTFSLMSSYLSMKRIISFAPKQWSFGRPLKKKKIFSKLKFI